MVKIYADGADIESISNMDSDERISGFTTNPTLIRKAGVTDYAAFCEMAAKATSKPISFEVIGDLQNEMERQAYRLHAMGDNVYVKIPITTTTGMPMYSLMRKLLERGIKVNVTAVMTHIQIEGLVERLSGILPTPLIVSIFCGRIADTGLHPSSLCSYGRMRLPKHTQILWASTRELLNIKQAEQSGCDIITVPNDMLKKLSMFGYDLTQYSLDTVKMFYDDAKASGFVL